MAVLTDYKGLDVVEGATGAGGVALTDNFKALADRAATNSTSSPGVSDDNTEGYFEGALWFDTATQTMWVCVNATTGAAVWKSFYTRSSTFLSLIPGDTTGMIGIGTTSPKATLHGTGSTIIGATSSAVANGDLGNGQVNIFLDETSGSEKLKFKVKLSSGTVKTGEISLS